MTVSKRHIPSAAAVALVLVVAAVSMTAAREGRGAAGERRPLVTLEFSGYWASGRLDVATDGTCTLDTPEFPARPGAMPLLCFVPRMQFAKLRAAVSAARWRSLRPDYPGMAQATDGSAYRVTHAGRSVGVSTWLDDKVVPRRLARLITLLERIYWTDLRLTSP